MSVDLASLQKDLETAKQECNTLREELNTAHNENTTLANENTYVRKKIAALQQQLDEQHKAYTRLESELYQQSQEVERLKKENAGYLKNKRDNEKKLREEATAFEKDRLQWQERETDREEREAELQEQVKALQATIGVLAQQNEQPGQIDPNAITSSKSSPATELAQFNANRDAKKALATIKERDQLIKQLRDDVLHANQEVTKKTSENEKNQADIEQLKNELEQVKNVNLSLMEENEVFQSLLHEKTIKGEFMLNPILQYNDHDTKRNENKEPAANGIKANNDLAAELNRASGGNGSFGEDVQKESDRSVDIEKLESKNAELEDKIAKVEKAHKALQVYIEKILSRIVETPGAEHLLSINGPAPSSPTTPTATTFSHSRTFSSGSALATAAPENKKLERRKTMSGALTSSEVPFKIKTGVHKVSMDEQGDQLSPLPSSPTSRTVNDGFVRPLADPPKRSRRNSASSSQKRWSILGNWVLGAKATEEKKKEDPALRPIILVQEKERKA